MKKTFDFGKIDYLGKGQKQNKVTVDVTLSEKKDGRPVFSVMGNIWNHKNTDIYSGGQNLDEIAEYIHGNGLFNVIYSMWEKHHLNDVHAGCEHRRNVQNADMHSGQNGNTRKYLKRIWKQ